MKNPIEAKHLLLLAITNSALKILSRETQLTSDQLNKVTLALMMNDSLVDNYPVTNNIKHVRQWSKSKLQEWARIDADYNMAEWHQAVLSTMVTNICSDMLGKGIDDSFVREKVRYVMDKATELTYSFTETIIV